MNLSNIFVFILNCISVRFNISVVTKGHFSKFLNYIIVEYDSQLIVTQKDAKRYER